MNTATTEMLKMDPIHFYCIQLYTKNGAMHFHAPLPTLLDSAGCYRMAQEIATTGKGYWGDDPYTCLGFMFSVDQINGVMVEHKATFTRAELLAHREMAKATPPGPFDSILRNMQ